ncbi:choice-of-anchor J domain-containing protein, partial [Paenimyroides baculatum]
MKKITHFFVAMFILLLGFGARSQVASYVFSHNVGTFTPNSSTATQLAAVEADFAISAVTPIGFNFVYGSSTYSDFKMSSDGYISFSATATNTGSPNLSTANAAIRPIIAPLWGDLDGNATVSGTKVSKATYQVTGTAPNRVLTVEWLNWEWSWSSTTPVISFQVKLYETTNVIEFVYRHETTANTTTTASIGINDATGSGNGSFLNLNTSMATPTVTSTTAVTSLSGRPVDNQIFRFTPPPCLYKGTVSVTNINIPTATLNLSIPASVDMDFFVTNGAAPTAGSTPSLTILSGQSSGTLSGLSGSSSYVVYVRYSCSSTGPVIGWVKALTFDTPCGIITGNFFEGFENSTVGSSTNQNAPYCWTNLNTTGYQFNYGYVYNFNAKTGTNCYYNYRYPLTTAPNGDMLLISPQTADLGNGTKQLRFSIRSSSTSTTPKLNIYRMNGVTGTAIKTLIQSIPIKSTTYTEYIVPLPVTNDDYFAFGFEHTKPGEFPTTYLDDIYYEDLSPCIFPSNIQASNISITGATITWNASMATGVTGYEYEIRTSGAPGTAGAIGTGSTTAPTTTFTTNILTGATTYYVYVRSVCGTSKGIWTMFPVEFNTLCPIYTNNFFEGFETTATGSSSNETYPLCWTYIDTVSPVNNAYNYVTTVAKTGSRGYYSYRYPLLQSDGQLMLVSPETNNLGNGTKQIRFWARSSSTSYSPKLVIYSMNGNTVSSTKTVVTSINIPSTTTFAEYIVPLPPTTDDYFAFSFEHQMPTQYTSIYLDDIYYEDMAACIFPLNIQTANTTTTGTTISWDASLGTGVTGYEYEIRTSGAAGSGATGLVKTGIVNAPATSVNITGLNHSTTYTVHIRSKCGTSNGMWTKFPLDFNTLCDVMTGNFFEGFETTKPGGSTNQNAPICWTNLNTTGYQYNYGYVYNFNARTGTNCFYPYRYPLSTAPNGDMLLISPETNNLGNGMKRLRFWVRSGYTGYTPNLKIYTMSGNTATAAATKTLVKSIPLTHDTYKEYIVYFPITTDDYFAFSFEHTDPSQYPYLYLDDIYYEDAPACKPIEDSTIKVTNIGKSSFTVSWQDLFNTTQMAYQVEVRTTGNPGTPGAVFNGTTAVGVTNLVATGLNPSTDYKVYVRSVCSSTEQSVWSSAVAATTLCNYSDFVSYTPSLALCGPQKAELSAVLVDPTAMAAWYDAKNDAIPLFEGPDFISATDITQDRSFWLRSRKTTANTPVQIGNGTLTDQYAVGSFLYHGWGGYRHQYIFTAAELTAGGLVAGPISALKFDIVNPGTGPRPDFSIAIGKATSTTAAIPMVPNSSLHQAYSSTSQTFTTGIMNFAFTTPYVWDGVSDLVVQTNWSTGTFGNNYGQLRHHTTTPNRTQYLYGDNQAASAFLATDSPAGSIYGSTTNTRPNTIFVGVAGCVS